MPALSPTMTEGNIAKWLLKPGDSFSAGDVILEVETGEFAAETALLIARPDKAQMEVEAQDDGVLAKILVADGSHNVQVGTPIAVLAEEGDNLDELEMPSAAPESNAAPAPAPEKEPSASPSGESAPKPAPKIADHVEAPAGQTLSPAVERLMHVNGISDASVVKGTGPQGRILKGDVLAYIGSIGKDSPVTLSKSLAKLSKLDLSNIKVAAAKPAATAPSAAPEAKPVPAPKPLTTVAESISLDALMTLRQRMSEQLGVEFTMQELVEKATAKAFEQVPQFARPLPLVQDAAFDELVGAKPPPVGPVTFKPVMSFADSVTMETATFTLPSTLPSTTVFTFEPQTGAAPVSAPEPDILDILTDSVAPAPPSAPATRGFAARIILDADAVSAKAAQMYLRSVKANIEDPHALLL